MPTLLTGAIVLKVPAEILGPGSDYERRRIELRTDYKAVLQEAMKLKEINSLADAEEATKLGRLLQVASKETTAFFKGIKTQVDAIKDPVLAAEKEDVHPLEMEKVRLGGELTKWNQKQAKEREAAEAREREAADAQALEEQLQRAIELEASGELDKMEEVLSDPTPPPPVIIQVQRPAKVSGQVGRTYYSAEVTNLRDLVKAVADGKAPIQALQANQSFINNQADQFKEGFDMPGCELRKRSSTSFRG